MEYTKPEVLTEESAICAIQAIGAKEHSPPDAIALLTSPTAYEADE